MTGDRASAGEPVTVSIVVPTHNRAERLAELLDSLSRIEVPEGERVEAVVVLDSCRDNSANLVGAVNGSLPFPLTLVEIEASSVSVARNRGIAESRGRIIVSLDDDVIFSPGWLRGLLSAFRSHPADIVGGRVALRWATGAPPEWFGPRHAAKLSACEHGDEVVELFRGEDILGANLALRREVVETVGAYATNLGRMGKGLLGYEETELMNRAIRHGFRLFYAPESLVHHFVGPERVTAAHLCGISYGHARSGVICDVEMSRWSAAHRILTAPAGMLVSLVRERWWRLRGDPSRSLRFAMRRHRLRGKAAGALDRLRGCRPEIPGPGEASVT
jgi:glucosyl-dolichyl phosphate glucuronosyltransferase